MNDKATLLSHSTNNKKKLFAITNYIVEYGGTQGEWAMGPWPLLVFIVDIRLEFSSSSDPEILAIMRSKKRSIFAETNISASNKKCANWNEW